MTTRTLSPRATPVPPTLGASAARLGLAVVAALAYLVGVPLLLADQPYWLNVLTNASMLSFASLGVWVTFAIGRINIAQGAFAMIGGYTTAILATRYGLPFWLCLPLSGLVAAAVGTAIGIPILRLRGVYFAMITLSLTEAVRLAFLNGGDLTKGATGIVNIPRPAGIDGPVAFYVLAAVPPPARPRWPSGASPPAAWAGSSARCARTRSWPPPSASTSPATASSPSPSPAPWAASPAASSPSPSRTSTPPPTPSRTRSTSCSTASWAGSTSCSGRSSAPSCSASRSSCWAPSSSTRRCSTACLMIAVMLFLPNGILSLTFRAQGGLSR